MKFRKFGRATSAAVLSLGVSAAFTACGRSGTNNTVDYVYVANSKNNPGQINVYYADADSGGLTQIPDSPYPTGGRNPVALTTLVVPKSSSTPGFSALYVINHDENTIVEFIIGTDAKLYPQHTYNTPGTFPNAMAVNSQGTLLFVTDTYQPQYTGPNPGPGALVVYPISQKDGSLGSPIPNGNLSYYPLSLGETNVMNPTAVNTVTQSAGGSFVYVVSQNSTTGLGSISAFSVAATGALTPLPCSSAAGGNCSAVGDGTFSVGTSPSAVTSTPLGRYLYVTDSALNQLFSYTVEASGQIVPTAASPANTDVAPDAVTVEPHGEYVYVANYSANNVDAFSINSSGVTAVGSYGTGTGPTCVLVEPALGLYLYTTNFLDNTVTGLNLDLTTGGLAPVQNTPFLAAGQPTCVGAIQHKTHPTITSAN